MSQKAGKACYQDVSSSGIALMVTKFVKFFLDQMNCAGEGG